MISHYKILNSRTPRFLKPPSSRFFQPLISISAKGLLDNTLTVCLTSSRPLILSFFQRSSLAKFSTFRRPLLVKFFCVSLRNELIYTQRCDLHEKTKHSSIILQCLSVLYTDLPSHVIFLNRLVPF